MRHLLPSDVVGVIVRGVFLAGADITADREGRYRTGRPVPLHQGGHGAAEKIGNLHERARPALEFEDGPVDRRNGGRYVSRGRHPTPFRLPDSLPTFRLELAQMQAPQPT